MTNSCLLRLKKRGVPIREIALLALDARITPARSTVSITTWNASKDALQTAFETNSPGKLQDFIEGGGSRGHRGQKRQSSPFHRMKQA